MMRDGMFVMTRVATFRWLHLSALPCIATATWAEWVKQQINTKRTHVFFWNYEPHSWGDLDDWEEPQKHKNESPIHAAPNFNELHLQLLSSQAEVLEQLWGVLQTKASLLDITRLSAYQQMHTSSIIPLSMPWVAAIGASLEFLTLGMSLYILFYS
jgi:hypothetical protein